MRSEDQTGYRGRCVPDEALDVRIWHHAVRRVGADGATYWRVQRCWGTSTL